MTHPIHFSPESKNGLSRAMNNQLQTVKISRQGNETNYTAAMIHELDDFEYGDDGWSVRSEGVVVDHYTTEPWAGADFTVLTTISQPGEAVIKKATLVQSKIGTVRPLEAEMLSRLRKRIEAKDNQKLTPNERLVKQILDMRQLTPSPKILEISRTDGGIPNVVSARGIFEDRRLQHQTFGDWIARRVLPTFDGDTRPGFTSAVLDTRLNKLLIYARKN